MLGFDAYVKTYNGEIVAAWELDFTPGWLREMAVETSLSGGYPNVYWVPAQRFAEAVDNGWLRIGAKPMKEARLYDPIPKDGLLSVQLWDQS